MTDDLTTRVEKLTRDIGELKDKRRDGWDKFQIIAALLIPASIAFVGMVVSSSLKEAEIRSAQELAFAQQKVARINARVGQARLVKDFMNALLSGNSRERKLAIGAMLIALPEEGPRLAEIVSETDDDPKVQAFAARNLLKSLIHGQNAAEAKALITKIETEFPSTIDFVALQYPDDVRDADIDGSKAKKLLRRLVVLTAKEPEDVNKWLGAFGPLETKQQLFDGITQVQIEQLIFDRLSAGARSCRAFAENDKRFLVCQYPPL